MPVDPYYQQIVGQENPLSPLKVSVEEIRNSPALQPPPPEMRPQVGKVEDRMVAGDIPIRIYTPMGHYTPQGQGPFPILLFFHGGGWILGNLDTHDVLCRNLTNETGWITIAVAYRLSPEHQSPAALNDCYEVTQWVAANAASLNGDPKRLAVSGDSAGGNLATVVCLRARDQRGPEIAAQVLLYPVIDYCQTGPTPYPSLEENGTGYGLTRNDLIFYWNAYVLNENEGKQPYASPIRAKDLSKLPPALIITAEYDPLRDEGEEYAARLREAGVPVVLKRAQGMLHSFLGESGPIQIQEAFALIRTFLAEMHNLNNAKE